MGAVCVWLGVACVDGSGLGKGGLKGMLRSIS